MNASRRGGRTASAADALRGNIVSKSGNPSATPAPRKRVRRDNCLFMLGLSRRSMGVSALPCRKIPNSAQFFGALAKFQNNLKIPKQTKTERAERRTPFPWGDENLSATRRFFNR